jgi:uncharacterized RDD family membrane protein YckC
MRCPSCDADSESSESCPECRAELGDVNDLVQQEQCLPLGTTIEVDDANPLEHRPTTRKSSTLIEFPGVSKPPLPQWRKELSERVREVQERRARDAAREAEEVEQKSVEAGVAPPQLELLPQVAPPAMNPLVAAALKRIERAHQCPADTTPQRESTAVALAYAPSREENESDEAYEALAETGQLVFDTTPETETEPMSVERTHNLVVVPTTEPEPIKEDPPPPPQPTPPPTPPAPKRLILDDPNDPALNYLDSICRNIRVEEIGNLRASVFKRSCGALLDLIVAAILSSPVYLVLKFSGTNLREIRPIAFIAGGAIIMAFLYFTISVALTGRTWAMRLLSLRVIDTKTGLIPTGGQSAGRAIVYLFSLVTVGLGIVYALLSREGDMLHDRVSGTAVIAN